MIIVTRLLLATGMLALSACAAKAGPTPEEQAKVEADIEAILTQPLADEDYAKSLRCLSTFDYESLEVLDDQRVLFYGRGDKVWINKLRNRCVGLKGRQTLKFNLRNNRVCDLDSFVAVENRGAGFDRVSGTCSLGGFQPITPEQADGIKAALKRD